MDRYDVGISKLYSGEFKNYEICPIYDNDKGSFFKGAICRSIYEICNKCLSYHSPKNSCPIENTRHLYRKWKATKNLDKRTILYNFANAKDIIKKTGKAVLVESFGSVWKLEEIGLHNSLALMGVELLEEQQILLERSGATKVYVLLDNDEAGKKGSSNIERQLYRSFNTKIIQIPNDFNDLGDMSTQDILTFTQNKQLQRIF